MDTLWFDFINDIDLCIDKYLERVETNEEVKNAVQLLDDVMKQTDGVRRSTIEYSKKRLCEKATAAGWAVS